MKRETAKRLEDARLASQELIAFAEGRSEQDLLTDRTFQLVVERLLSIIGEAINIALREAEGELVIPSVRNIVGLRNRIVHDYDAIRPDIIWRVIEENVPALERHLTDLLADVDD